MSDNPESNSPEPDKFYVVAATSELSEGQQLYVELDGEEIMLCRQKEGYFALAWVRANTSIRIRFYNQAGIAQTNEFRLNRQDSNYMNKCKLAALPDGGLLVIWHTYSATTSKTVQLVGQPGPALATRRLPDRAAHGASAPPAGRSRDRIAILPSANASRKPSSSASFGSIRSA